MLVFQTNPVAVEPFSYVKTLFCFNKFASILATRVKTLYVTNLVHRTHNNVASKIKWLLLITNVLFPDMYPPAYPDIDNSIFWIIFKGNF